jgi:predicted transcriptional regulator of viral defense system
VNAAGAIAAVDRSGLKILTTREASALWRIHPKAANEMLRRLAKSGLTTRLRRGLWAFGRVDVLEAVERLCEPDVGYVSLLTALRIREMIDQIPGMTYVATTGRARRLSTPLGVYSFHHVDPVFYGGFERVRGVPIATPEKALVDTFYLSGAKIRDFAALPELEIPAAFSKKRALEWARRIRSGRIRERVREKLLALV